MTLALCLLFLTGLLENLPKAVLAAVVLTAVAGLFDFPALLRMWRVSRIDFYAAAIALGAVLLSASCRDPARRARLDTDAAGPRVASRTWRSSDAFPERTAIPISPVIPTTSRCPA